MKFISNVVANLQEKFRESQQKKKEEQEFLRRLQLQAEAEKRIIFEEEFKKDARLVALAQAKKEASEKSGLQKLRATDRLRRLQKQSGDDTSFFGRLGAYTRKNLARREENLKLTAERRKIAQEMKEENFRKQQELRNQRLARATGGKQFGRI